MKKVHLDKKTHTTSLNMPFCGAKVTMSGKDFLKTEVESEVTCRLCLMRMGVIEDTRGNWDNRTR